MNRVTLMGRLTRDPEVRYSQAAEPMAIVRFGIAVNRRFKREGQPDADFINCIAFGKTAENIEKFFSKGRMIAIEGNIQTGSYEKEGTRVFTTDIVVQNFHFTGEKREEGAQQSNTPNDGFTPIAEDVSDDDLPF